MADAGKLGFKNSLKSYLNSIYFQGSNQTELQAVVPKLIIGNTNWDSMPHVSCLFDLSENAYKIVFMNDNFSVVALELEQVRFPNKWLYHNPFNFVEGNSYDSCRFYLFG